MNFYSICLIATTVTLPFSLLVKLEFGIITFTIYLLFLLLLIPILLIKFFDKNSHYNFSIVDTLLILLCLIYFSSTILSADIVGSGYMTFHALFIPVVSYAVNKGLIDNYKNSDDYIKYLVISITIYELLCVLQFLVSAPSQRIDILGWDQIAQATFALTAIAYLVYGGVIKRKTIRMIFIVINLSGLVITLSRAYILVLLVTPLLYFIVKKGLGTILFILILVTSLSVTILFTNNPEILKNKKWDPKYENTIERIRNIEYWKYGMYTRFKSFYKSFNSFKRNPILGTGMKRKIYGATTHNLHLEWLEYGGILGYLFYALVFIVTIARANKWSLNDPIVNSSIVIAIAIWVNGLTNGIMHGVMPYAIFIVIGIIENRNKLSKDYDKYSIKTFKEGSNLS